MWVTRELWLAVIKWSDLKILFGWGWDPLNVKMKYSSIMKWVRILVSPLGEQYFNSLSTVWNLSLDRKGFWWCFLCRRVPCFRTGGTVTGEVKYWAWRSWLSSTLRIGNPPTQVHVAGFLTGRFLNAWRFPQCIYLCEGWKLRQGPGSFCWCCWRTGSRGCEYLEAGAVARLVVLGPQSPCVGRRGCCGRSGGSIPTLGSRIPAVVCPCMKKSKGAFCSARPVML